MLSSFERRDGYESVYGAGRKAFIVVVHHGGKHRAFASWTWGYGSFDCHGTLHGLSLFAEIAMCYGMNLQNNTLVLLRLA